MFCKDIALFRVGLCLSNKMTNNLQQKLVKLKMSCENGQRQKLIIIGSFFYRKNNVAYDYEIRQRSF